jgi:hypothetical protein
MQDRVVRLVLPDEIGPAHIASMQAECERLADLAGRHPKTMAVLQNAVLQGDQQATDQAIDHLGLRQPPPHHVLGELAVVGRNHLPRKPKPANADGESHAAIAPISAGIPSEQHCPRPAHGSRRRAGGLGS